MASILLVIFFIGYFIWADHVHDRKVDNYNTRNVNWNRFAVDKSKYGWSDKEAQRQMLSGKYDWKEGEYDPIEKKYH